MECIRIARARVQEIVVVGMNDIENRYQSPVSEESLPDAARLTKEEWRYAGKVFVVATLAAAIVRGAFHTWLTIYMSPVSSAEGRAAGIMAVSSMRVLGGVAALFGMCIALILVIGPRAKAGVPPPNRGLFGPMFLIVPLCTPLAALVICGVCIAILLLTDGHVWTGIWRSIVNLYLLEDTLVGSSMGATTSFIYAALGTDLARWIARMHNWTISMCIAVWFITAWTSELVHYVLMLVTHPRYSQ